MKKHSLTLIEHLPTLPEHALALPLLPTMPTRFEEKRLRWSCSLTRDPRAAVTARDEVAPYPHILGKASKAKGVWDKTRTAGCLSSGKGPSCT